MQVSRSSLLLSLTLVALLLPSTASAEENCRGQLFVFSFKVDELKKILPDGTERRSSEYSIGLCVDPMIKNEVIAALQSGRAMSGEALEGVRVAIREGRAAVHFVTESAAAVGAGAIEKGRAVAAGTADLSGAALALLASGASWAWQTVARPANATPPQESTSEREGCWPG